MLRIKVGFFALQRYGNSLRLHELRPDVREILQACEIPRTFIFYLCDCI
jgi:hypothetical protein